MIDSIKRFLNWFVSRTEPPGPPFIPGQQIELQFRDYPPWRIPAMVVYSNNAVCLTLSERLGYWMVFAPDWKDDRGGHWSIVK